MASSYLEIAERILRRNRVPMTPHEILAHAYHNDEMPTHLFGRTQEKTLQARLSEDIARLREKSVFFRTNRARFFLRSFKSDPNIPDAFKTEYLARPRYKDYRTDRFLCLESQSRLLDGELPVGELFQSLRKLQYRYLTWREIESDSRFVPVYSFLIVHTHDSLLSYSAGRFTIDADPAKGHRSIGFGGIVRAQDSDILYNAMYGIIGSAIKELVYSLGLPSELTRAARYNDLIRVHLAVTSRANALTPYLKVVLSYRCPAGYHPDTASLALNKLRWIDFDDLVVSERFDHISNHLIMNTNLRSILASAGESDGT